jgi:hypothetical protein
LVASESTTQLVTDVGGAGTVELRQPVRDWGSHSPNHNSEDSDCCDKGSRNEGPTCCTKKPHWGTVKKACGVDQYEAPSMDGSKEDGRQAALESHTGVLRRCAASTSMGLRPWTG